MSTTRCVMLLLLKINSEKMYKNILKYNRNVGKSKIYTENSMFLELLFLKLRETNVCYVRPSKRGFNRPFFRHRSVGNIVHVIACAYVE